MENQWDKLFAVFGWPKGGFHPGTRQYFGNLEQLMRRDADKMMLEGQAAEALLHYQQHQAEQLGHVALQNFKAGVFFAFWLTGSTFFHRY
ncbi:hypothetical protein [Allofournierella sp.]|uniref:hypothetical protein n=1 Tax=Allofournierella sp. TaxID=1940256 RepID=UPI003AB1FB7E